MADTCTISGNVSGLDLQLTWVSDVVEILFVPVLPASAGPTPSIIMDRTIVAKPDESGNFSANIAKNATVKVIIPRAKIDKQIVVPDAETANLVDLI